MSLSAVFFLPPLTIQLMSKIRQDLNRLNAEAVVEFISISNGTPPRPINPLSFNQA